MARLTSAPDAAFDPIAEARRQWVKHWGGAPAPSMSAVTALMRVQQILMTRLNALLKPYDLTFPRYEALMILRVSRRGALPLGKIGARLQVHPTSVTNLIDGLERAGLVRREPHAQDRRATLAIITERGAGARRRRDGGAQRREIRHGAAPGGRSRDDLADPARVAGRRGRLRPERRRLARRK